MRLTQIVVLAVLIVFSAVAVHAQSQVCTPIAMSNSPNDTGSGTGPTYAFKINGNQYIVSSGSSTNITVPATVTFGDIGEWGFVNVYGSFHAGGTCINTPWYANVKLQPKLFDLTTGVWVEHCCGYIVENQAEVTTASFSFYYDYGASGTPGTITLTSGHVYQWEMITSTYVFGLGNTPTYSGSVILTIE